MKTFKLITSYGEFDDAYLELNNYEDNMSLCIRVWSKTVGCIASLTENLSMTNKLPYNKAFVNVSCSWAKDFIKENNLGKFTGVYMRSGYRKYPLYEFNLELLNEYAKD